MTRSTRDVVNGEDLRHYSDPPLLVLISRADEPKQGHAMLEDNFRMSGTRLGPGTLYGAIAGLEREKVIEPLPDEESRQPYRQSPGGVGLNKLESR